MFIRNSEFEVRNSSKGFTLIELLIVLALTAILATVAVVGIGGYRVSNDLQRTGEEVVASLRNTRHRSMSQENGTRWGMRFSNASSGETYTSFGGTSFASSTSKNAYTLGNGILFGNPPTSTSIDVLFDPITGDPSQNQIISLNDGRKDNLVYDVIADTLGSIEGRFEQGLVGYWHFDEGTGTAAYDASGNGNNGTLMSAPTWTAGSNCEAGSCLSFNGTNNYVSILNTSFLPLGSKSRTMTGWIKTNGTKLGRTVYFGYGGASTDLAFDLASGISNNGKIYFIGYGDDLAGNTIVGDGNWHFIAVTYNGTTVTLYVDGKFDSSALKYNLNTSNVATYPFVIGRQSYPDSGTNYWYQNGWIDEVRVYNKALSAQDIQDLYNETQ